MRVEVPRRCETLVIVRYVNIHDTVILEDTCIAGST
jgi:hypothetical protein